MDNATENTAANRAVFREGGTLDPNVTAAAPLGGAANAAMDGRASGPGAVRNGHRERAPDARVGRVAPRIPKLREGACLPGAIAEAWARGAVGIEVVGTESRASRRGLPSSPRRSRPPTPTSRTGTAGGCGPTTSRGRVNPEVRRRARVATALPSAESPVRLVGAVRLDQDDAWQDPARLIDPRRLREGYESPELRGATGDRAKRFLTVVEGAFSDDLRKVA